MRTEHAKFWKWRREGSRRRKKIHTKTCEQSFSGVQSETDGRERERDGGLHVVFPFVVVDTVGNFCHQFKAANLPWGAMLMWCKICERFEMYFDALFSSPLPLLFFPDQHSSVFYLRREREREREREKPFQSSSHVEVKSLFFICYSLSNKNCSSSSSSSSSSFQGRQSNN